MAREAGMQAQPTSNHMLAANLCSTASSQAQAWLQNSLWHLAHQLLLVTVLHGPNKLPKSS